jgi:hypothetical protein
MFPPVDPTRRRFLSHAACAAAGGGVLALASLSPAVAAPVPSPAAGPVDVALDAAKASPALRAAAIGGVA